MAVKISAQVRQLVRETKQQFPKLTNQEISDKLNIAISTVKTTLRRPKISMSVEDRFWSFVDKSSGPEKCWPWTGHRHPDGYGGFYIDKQNRWVPASRACLFLLTGEWAINACHTCDNPPCVNPAHLFAGSVKDNVQDAIKKGRKATYSFPGERNPKSKLTEEDVWQIRTLFHLCSRKDLAVVFGVNASTVSSIGLGKTWKHL